MASENLHQKSVASFFSGIGGFDLGLQNAGFKIGFQCEIDEFCTRILQRHWPSVERRFDIREVRNGSTFTGHEIWCAGFPCQDVSVARARNRKGLAGQHSGLFFEFARLLGEGRPPVVILENVTGLLSSNEGRDFSVVINALAELGYSVGWRVLNSRFFGVPQSRRRLYIIGYRGNPSQVASILFEPERSSRHPQKSGSSREKPVSPFKEELGKFGQGPVVQRVAYCLAATSGRHTGTDWSRTYVTYSDAVRRITPLEAERLQGFPDNWTIPADTKEHELDDHSLDSQRYTALGNAVTVNVAEWLGKRLRSVLLLGEYTEEPAVGQMRLLEKAGIEYLTH